MALGSNVGWCRNGRKCETWVKNKLQPSRICEAEGNQLFWGWVLSGAIGITERSLGKLRSPRSMSDGDCRLDIASGWVLS